MLALVAGGVVLALLLGLGAMFLGQSSRPTAPGSPTAGPAAPPGGGPRPVGTDIDLGHGITLGTPAGWTKIRQATGTVTLRNASGTIGLQLLAGRSGSDAVAQCADLLAQTTARLGNAQQTACRAGAAYARVATAQGGVSGTLATQQGSTPLTELVGTGRRADGLSGAASILWSTRQPPSQAEQQEAVAVYGTLLAAVDAAP